MNLMTESQLTKRRQLLQSTTYNKSSVALLVSTVMELIDNNDFSSLLDYGSAQGILAQQLTGYSDLVIQSYDPALPEFEQPPEPAEFVVCLDTLSTIESTAVDAVLDHLASLTKQLIMITISNSPSPYLLNDGRNEYLLQKPPSWWLPKLVARFELDHLLKIEDGRYLMLLTPQQNPMIH